MRYREQAEAVLRMAARASSSAEKEVYASIAEGWRRLAEEAARNEIHEHHRFPGFRAAE